MDHAAGLSAQERNKIVEVYNLFRYEIVCPNSTKFRRGFLPETLQPDSQQSVSSRQAHYSATAFLLIHHRVARKCESAPEVCSVIGIR